MFLQVEKRKKRHLVDLGSGVGHNAQTSLTFRLLLRRLPLVDVLARMLLEFTSIASMLIRAKDSKNEQPVWS